MSSTSNSSNPDFDEFQWISKIRQNLDKNIDKDNEIRVSIFNVPKTLKTVSPDSYTPRQISIGPYHYLRPELYEMEGYKIAAARRTQQLLENRKFEDEIVAQIMMLESSIRGCYHKVIKLSHEAFAWMMAIDAAFLLELLEIYDMKESKTCNLIDSEGFKSFHTAVLGDIMMLENQIPLFVLRKMLEVRLSSVEQADEMLLSMLTGLCKEISPFQMDKTLPIIKVSEISHLLDWLYRTIVPKVESVTEISESDEVEEQSEASPSTEDKEKMCPKPKLMPLVKRVQRWKPVQVIPKLPLTILTQIPVVSRLKETFQNLFSAAKKAEVRPEDDGSENSRPPRVEEITIPSVSELRRSGVLFEPTSGNVLTIAFDVDTATLKLPAISLDVNTEVVLRNLVAYEASYASGPLVFARYTELMNGIIDTKEDVKLLREKGIVLNHLKSDQEAADLWNGTTKSIRLTKVPFLDKVIEDINGYYNGRWSVKARNLVKLYVFGSWQILTLLSAAALLVLTAIQAFCSFYSCRAYSISIPPGP